MIRKIAIGGVLAAFVLTAASALALGRAPADPTAAAKASAAHTVTWWCVDLNDVFKVNVAVLTVRPWLLGGPPCATTSSWPQAIPAGSQFATDSAWITNKTYPKPIADGLGAMPGGYHFASNSPMEDFLSKIIEVKYVVLDFVTGDPVTQFAFDPRTIFRRAQWGDLLGGRSIDPIVDPALGLGLDEAAVRRLPLTSLPGIASPLPAGSYLVQTVWTLSERHCDGLGLDPDNNCLAAGDNLMRVSRFDVFP